jgi:hypothetical protein
MAYSITNLKQELQGILHGTQLNQITSLGQLIYRAARDVLMDCDPYETTRIIPITNSVFNSVYDYPCPPDLKGTAIIDIRPQVNRNTTDLWLQWYNQNFDLQKQTSYVDSVSIQWDTAVKTLRINSPTLTPQASINTCDSLTANGTWADNGSGNITSLVVDNVNYVNSSGSLSFTLASSAIGYLENSTMSAVDLSDWEDQGTFFMYTFLPTAANISLVTMTIGSSSGNSYSMSATTTQQGTAFQDGWNLLKFEWSGAVTSGTPDSSALDYLLISWTNTGSAQTNVRIDQVTAALGTILEIEYYSKYLFRNATSGAFAETIADDSDYINLDTDSYNLLVYKVAQLAVQQQQGIDALGYDGQYFKDEYDSRLSRYWYLYKSQKQKVTGFYYSPNRPAPPVTPTRRGF